eukprot:CAMPEP_0197884472 /NCGR_PEP_ID=MMETSP1439-20131203/10911_1 /TAXON_ID=66791 /ORGANISM="Gonyaulax spinifera, Strain CCMP409" /LENGTH=147 /DNA_ID=CAMNT_0043504205 /DNA_START=29 /DNA_END=470 /DNA_ORIENTATION=+
MAVATKGPVVISVDASPWGEYKSGIFTDCSINATVNHAVLLVGYGRDEKYNLDYWLIRNSWGDWGEGGYIRLQRHESDSGEAGHCGVDKDPKAGVACDGSPKSVPVCGIAGAWLTPSTPLASTSLRETCHLRTIASDGVAARVSRPD